MNYNIVIEKTALKFLIKQQQGIRDRIMKVIQGLPDIGDIKKMASHSNLY